MPSGRDRLRQSRELAVERLEFRTVRLEIAQRMSRIHGVVNRTQQPPTQIGAFPVAKLSKATGGGYIMVREKDDLRSLMKQVTEELRHEYLIGFTPAVADNREHTVKVEVATPGHQAMARATQKASRK